MDWLRATLREVLGLFIDDGSFAFAIVFWLGVIWLTTRLFHAFTQWGGPILFLGLVLLLFESAWRTARSRRQAGRKTTP